MEWLVSTDEAGLQLDAWLQRKLPTAPPGYLRQLIRSGKICRLQQPLSRETRLACGDRISLPESERLRQLSAQTPAWKILRQTDHWLIVDKPSGLPVHANRGHDSNLTDQVQQLCKQQSEPFRVAPAHRLDLETSGPVLFAKGRKASGTLGKLVMAGGLEKSYLALVCGRPAASGLINTPLANDSKLQTAVTRFKRLRCWPDCSLLLVSIDTGRKHQIRRHLAGIGHPLAGDTRYRAPLPSPAGRIFLHQATLAFVDPWQAQPVRVSSKLPAELQSWLRALGPMEASAPAATEE